MGIKKPQNLNRNKSKLKVQSMKIHSRKYFYKKAEKQRHRGSQVAKTIPK